MRTPMLCTCFSQMAKRPIARTFDLDQVAVRVVDWPVVVAVSPEIIGVKRDSACGPPLTELRAAGCIDRKKAQA